MILVIFLIFILICSIAALIGFCGKRPHVRHRQQPPRNYHEDTGEFTQEELDYWYLNQQDEDE